MKHTWKQDQRWIQGIPDEVFGGLEFYERREVKDLCADLRLIVNPLDQEALLRIINQPRRGIGEETLDKLTSFNRQNQIPLWNVLIGVVKKDSIYASLSIASQGRKGLEEFIAVLEEADDRFTQRTLTDSLEWLIKRIDYQRAIKEEVSKASKCAISKPKMCKNFWLL